MKRIVILGAGISGLSLAWFLKQHYKDNIELTILEKNSRPGGWLQTISKNGFLFELGPRSIRGGEETLSFIEELGLQNEVCFASTEAKYRYLWFEKKLKPLPHNLYSLLSSSFLPLFVKAGLKKIFSKGAINPYETIAQYSARRFGSAFTETLIDPFFSGIFAGDIHKLSARACWKKKTLGAKIFSFKNGLSTLIDTLARRFEKELILNSEVTSLKCLPTYIEINGIKADHAFCTLPSQSLSALLPQLKTIPHASIIAVNLGYQQAVLQKKGFGYLIPSKEGERILGVIFDSSVFPVQNRADQTRLTVMLGGVRYPEMMKMSDSLIESIVLNGIERHLGIKTRPDLVNIQRNAEAIPQYFVGHQEAIAEIESQCQKLSFGRMTLLGNSFYGVSIADCIAKSKNTILNKRVEVHFS